MPMLYILAGPNGAGKTTFYQTAVQEGFISPSLPFLNIDIITKDELGGYSETNFARAEELYRERICELLSLKADFMIESNPAKDAEYDWIRKMKGVGYAVVLYYLCTDYASEIHVERVRERVAEGGHNVPENIVLHRYKMSLLYLKTNLFLFTEVYLIDNENTATEAAHLQDGLVVRKNDRVPVWVTQSLAIVERLGKRK